HRECLLAIFNGARPGNDREILSANRSRSARKANDGVFFFDVAADQLVRLRYPDDFLHARHIVQRALLDFALVARDADRGAGSSGHGVRPVSERLDSLTDGAYLLFRGMRLHHDQHDPTSNSRVYQNATAARVARVPRALLP